GQMLAGVLRAVAGVGRACIAIVGARRARGDLRVGRAGGAGAGAVLRGVTLPGGDTTNGEAREEVVRRARAARPVAVFGDVARARRPAAHRPGVPRRVLTRSVRPVASVGRADVAVVRARGAGRRLVVRRTRGARPGAVLRRVALPARRPADYGRWRERVGGTRRGRAVAGLI